MVKIWEAYLTVRVIVGECETFPRKARKGKVTWTVETRDSLPPHTYNNSQESERLRLHCIKLWLGRGGKRQPCSTQYHPYSRSKFGIAFVLISIVYPFISQPVATHRPNGCQCTHSLQYRCLFFPNMFTSSCCFLTLSQRRRRRRLRRQGVTTAKIYHKY